MRADHRGGFAHLVLQDGFVCYHEYHRRISNDLVEKADVLYRGEIGEVHAERRRSSGSLGTLSGFVSDPVMNPVIQSCGELPFAATRSSVLAAAGARNVRYHRSRAGDHADRQDADQRQRQR